jgi:prepilin-type processing-associated H-X9-DG protein/prepilin-type N-terminal cleavage/methylation domain-containing protein
MNARPRTRAFSLTELLVVIAVIVIIAAMLIVGINQAYSNAIQIKCQHRLEQLGQAFSMYSAKSRGTLPQVWSGETGVAWYESLAITYLDDPRVLACPLVNELPHIRTADEIEGINRSETTIYMPVLNWLKDNQMDCGRWDGIGADASWWRFPQAMTGYAIMAFIGYGCTDTSPPEYKDTLLRAVEYLSGPLAQYKTGPNAGRITGTVSGYQDGSHIYVQGIALMALAAAYKTIEDADVRAQVGSAIELGLEWINSKQPWHGCFAYSEGASDSNKGDTQACGWAYEGIGACKEAGFALPAGMETRADEFFAHNTANNGKAGYRWYPPPTGASTADWLQERHTCTAMMAWLAMGKSTGESTVQAQLAYITRPAYGSQDHIYYFTHPTKGSWYRPGDGTDRYQFYHTTRALKRIGGTYWSNWVDGNPSLMAEAGTVPFEGFPKYIYKHLIDAGTDGDGQPMAYWPQSVANSAQSGSQCGDLYATTLSLCFLSYSHTDHWEEEGQTGYGDGWASYGYNNQLGRSGMTVSTDTIIVMDYSKAAVDRDDFEPENNDTDAEIAFRHGGRANVLFADGAVRPLTITEFKAGMFTPKAGD